MEAAEHRRRIPRQERSRRRVEAILVATEELVGEVGGDALTVSGIAERAGVPIGSVYQYFPDKQAILRELAARVMAGVGEQIAAAMSGITDREEALDRLDQVLVGYHALLVFEPRTRDIWASLQSDKELADLDLEDSRVNAAVIAESLRHLARPEQRHRVDDVALLLTHLSGAAARLALASGPEEGERLFTEFRLAVRHQVSGLLVDG